MGDELSDTSLRGRACLDCVSLLGDWHVLSAVVPVGTSSITADIVWQGTMIEFTPDSVRFHRHDLAYPASYPGETIDVNLQFYPIKYSSDGKSLGSAKAMGGIATFAAQSGSVVVAKIGKESVKIAVK